VYLKVAIMSKSASQRKTPWDRSSSVEKACQLLRCFTPARPIWRISELARQLKFPKSAVFRMVRTLDSQGFLRRKSNSVEYELGFRIFELTGIPFGETKWLSEKADPYLKQINERCGFLASLSSMDHDEIVILARVEAIHALKVAYPVGTHQPCNHGASGKLLLAYNYSKEEIRELLRTGKIKKLTEKTKTDFSDLVAECRKIARLGYAENDGEAVRGTVGIAAPVYSSNGQVIAALAITAPESLCTLKQLKNFIPMLIREAAMLSRDLGFQKPATGSG
jgi:IclR family transcriptional regulator, KDG regulon repressor